MDQYYPLSSDEIPMFKNSFRIDNSNKGEEFLRCIKKKRIDKIKADTIYCQKKIEELFAIDLFFDLKLLRESVDWVMKAIEEASGRVSSGVILLKICDSKLTCLQKLYSIQRQIASDPRLRNNHIFLTQWAEYVLNLLRN